MYKNVHHGKKTDNWMYFFLHLFDEVEARTRQERDGEQRAGTACAQSAQNELGKKMCATNVASLTGAGRGGSPYLSAKL